MSPFPGLRPIIAVGAAALTALGTAGAAHAATVTVTGARAPKFAPKLPGGSQLACD